jgi:uncharacterized RDD family membrane protein YckC
MERIMSEPFEPLPTTDARAGDRAVAILRDLEAHKTDAPEVASLGTRLIARVIDLVIVFCVLFVALFAYGIVRRIVVGAKEWETPVTRGDFSPALYLTSVLALFVALLVYEIATTHLRQQTAGKRLLGIKIALRDGETAPPRQAVILRTLLWAAPFVLIVTLPTARLLGVVLALVAIVLALLASRDGEQRAYYDRIAGTRVVGPR